MTNYSRGANFERRVKADLIGKGYVAIRAAGSHGVADIVAMQQFDTPMMIQVKKDGALGRAERAALIAEAKKAGAMPVMAAHVRGKGIVYTVVNHASATATRLHVGDSDERP